MNTFDPQNAQQHYEIHHELLLNEMREARAMEVQIKAAFSKSRNWLGARLVEMGAHLQGPQDTQMEWTHQ
ncbi:MAG: hypothetical protein AAF702_42715 [Chloroflexota bacterium]